MNTHTVTRTGTQATSHDRKAAPSAGRSIRPAIEHALTVYYDGNAELARTLIDQLIAEHSTPSDSE